MTTNAGRGRAAAPSEDTIAWWRANQAAGCLLMVALPAGDHEVSRSAWLAPTARTFGDQKLRRGAHAYATVLPGSTLSRAPLVAF